MRVLQVINALTFGGAERMVVALCEGLLEHGHRPAVATLTAVGPLAEDLRRLRVPVHHLRLRHALDIAAAERFRRLLRDVRPDIMHSHLAVPDLLCRFGRAWVGGPWLSSVHHMSGQLSVPRRTLWQRALHGADRVLPVSSSVLASLPEPVRRKSEVLHPSLMPKSVLAAPELSPSEARRRLGLAGDRPLVLAVGRLRPVKGFDLLGRLAARWYRQGIDVAIIGDGPERARLDAYPHLQVLGSRADAPWVLSAASVVACPSQSEGFPQVPLEAQALGVPVVATRVGGMAEVVEDEVSGLLVPYGRDDAFSEAVVRVCRQPGLAQRLGEGGRRRVADRELTREGMQRRALDQYERALARPT